jgi:hypothetical protein
VSDTSTAPEAPLAQAGAPVHRWTPNRIVAIGTAAAGVVILVAGFAASLAVPAAVAAVLAGAALIAVPVREWLIGWREFEARQGEADEPVDWADVREAIELLVERDRAKASGS